MTLQTTSNAKILFVSHAYADMEHALLLKRAIEGCFPDVTVFDASDPGTIKPGDDWVHSVLRNLKDSSVILVVATERSVKRNWVWFEAGACWERSSKLLTCTIGKVHKGSLPLPFAIYIALCLTGPEDLESLFDILSVQLGAKKRIPDFDDLARRFTEIERATVADQAALEDPLVQERWEIVRQTADSLEKPAREALKLLLLYGSATDYSMLEALKSRGLVENWSSVLPGLQMKTNLVQRVAGQPSSHPNLAPTSVEWEIKPDFRPLIRRYFEERRASMD